MKSNLKEMRVTQQWDQESFAQQVGISVSHLSLIENEKRTPSLDVALRIADELGLCVGEIWWSE